jgi:hypothetical protein
VFGHVGFFSLGLFRLKPAWFSPMGRMIMGTLEWVVLILVLLFLFGGGGYYWSRRGA